MRVASAALVGGTTSSLAGGKFANGAMSGAFVMLFNQMEHDNNGQSDDNKTNASPTASPSPDEDITKGPIRRFFFLPENPWQKIKRFGEELLEKFTKKLSETTAGPSDQNQGSNQQKQEN